MTDPIPVMEFEGSFVREMEGQLPGITLDMPEGYKRGTHLTMDVEVRVRNVIFKENKDGDLIRQHVFALEEIKLVDAFDPAVRPNNVGGNSAGDVWVEALIDYLEERTDELDFEGEKIPDRLREMLELVQTEEIRRSLESVPVVHHPVTVTDSTAQPIELIQVDF